MVELRKNILVTTYCSDLADIALCWFTPGHFCHWFISEVPGVEQYSQSVVIASELHRQNAWVILDDNLPAVREGGMTLTCLGRWWKRRCVKNTLGLSGGVIRWAGMYSRVSKFSEFGLYSVLFCTNMRPICCIQWLPESTYEWRSVLVNGVRFKTSTSGKAKTYMKWTVKRDVCMWARARTREQSLSVRF